MRAHLENCFSGLRNAEYSISEGLISVQIFSGDLPWASRGSRVVCLRACNKSRFFFAPPTIDSWRRPCHCNDNTILRTDRRPSRDTQMGLPYFLRYGGSASLQIQSYLMRLCSQAKALFKSLLYPPPNNTQIKQTY